ncbi:MAG: DUF2298 domain-containing protein, partial [Chloroflexota bacterium]|nr:DUF2298 domain-containing protein [Chloroflexota bacterium]
AVAIAAATATVAAAILPWAPFLVRFVPPPGGEVAALPAVVRDVPVLPTLLTAVGVHGGERTSVAEFLTIFGVPYVAALWLIAHEWMLSGGRAGTNDSRPALLLALPVLVAALVLPAPVLLLAGLPLAVSIGLLRDRRDLSPSTLALALFALGLALVFAVELFYIRDVFGSRMNTLFKVYYQVWTLFALGAALAAVALWRAARPRRIARPALATFFGLSLLAGGAYPVLASERWTEGFADWKGLDGIAYVDGEDPDELAAIRWLQQNAREEDLLLEAAGCAYYPISRVPFNRASAFTGVPTVIGWAGHERQWRPGQPELMAEIPRRQADVAAAFAEPGGEAIDRYGVTLLFVGRYERDDVRDLCEVAGPYPEVRSSAFPGPGWELAFSEGDARIYRRAASAGSG